MVIGNVEIKNTIETITAEIRESMTLLEMAYGESEDEKTSAVISCVMRSTNSSLRKADSLVNTLLATKEYAPSKTGATQNSFAARLRLALNEQGMTQTDLAREANVSQSFISMCVNGKVASPKKIYIELLATALSVDFEWLKSGSGEMYTSNFLNKNNKV